MIKKVFKVTTGADEEGIFSDNIDGAVVLATTAEEAIKIYKEKKEMMDEFIISVEHLSTIDFE